MSSLSVHTPPVPTAPTPVSTSETASSSTPPTPAQASSSQASTTSTIPPASSAAYMLADRVESVARHSSECRVFFCVCRACYGKEIRSRASISPYTANGCPYILDQAGDYYDVSAPWKTEYALPQPACGHFLGLRGRKKRGRWTLGQGL